jgi:hypothetical protein
LISLISLIVAITTIGGLPSNSYYPAAAAAVLPKADDHSRLSSNYVPATVTASASASTIPPSVSNHHQHADDVTVTVEPKDYIYNKKGWNTAPIVIEKYKLVFFTIPKVGCTTWKQLFRRMMGYNNWKAPDPHNPKTNGLTYLSHYTTSRATEIMNDPTYTKAIFLRDPKERLLSAYLQKVVQSEGKDFMTLCCKYATSNNKEQEEQLCRSQAPTLSFPGFVHWTTTICRDDDHWRPQSLRMENKFLQNSLNFVGHMETADRDAKQLLQHIGAWEAFGTTGWGPPSGRFLEGSRSTIPHATSKSAEESWSRLSNYYTPELESIVEDYYKDDYSLAVYNLTTKHIQFE